MEGDTTVRIHIRTITLSIVPITLIALDRIEELGLAPEDLARAAIVDLLATPGDDFKAAAERVLRKNEELYRRLA